VLWLGTEYTRHLWLGRPGLICQRLGDHYLLGWMDY
jgi:hypothetical protein